jgi:hypothetical protein
LIFWKRIIPPLFITAIAATCGCTAISKDPGVLKNRVSGITNVVEICRSVAAQWVQTRKEYSTIRFIDPIFADANVQAAASAYGVRIVNKADAVYTGGRFFMTMSDKAGIMLTFTRIKFLADGVTVTISSSYGASSDQQEYDLICADGRWIVRGVRTISGS